MSLQRLIINSDLSAVGFRSVCDLSPGQLPATENFLNYIAGLTGGNYMALLSFATGAVQATATFTHTGTAANGQIGTLLNTNLTAVTAGAVPASGQFNISGTPATQAASMVLAINAVLGTKVLATNLLGVVTITSLVPGVMGNGLQISAGNLANVAAGAWANGSDGTAYTIDLR
jgi:hypothetical protein